MSEQETAAPEQDTAAPEQDASVYKRQVVAGPDADAPVGEVITLDVNVSVWEVQTEGSITVRFSQLENSELQIRTTLEQLDANGAKGGEDYVQLDAKRNEVIRQMEHIRKTLNPGDVILLGKVKGTSQVSIGKSWNQCLDRHVILDNGIVTRVLWKSPL